MVHKKVFGESVFYAINWSKKYQYNRILVSRVLPDMPGIIIFYDENDDRPLLIYACWREGVRMGMKVLFDPILTRHRELLNAFSDKRFVYKYCVIDSSPKDLLDIFYYLVREYDPELNDSQHIQDSKRYKEINLHEVQTDDPTGKFTAPGMFD